MSRAFFSKWLAGMRLTQKCALSLLRVIQYRLGLVCVTRASLANSPEEQWTDSGRVLCSDQSDCSLPHGREMNHDRKLTFFSGRHAAVNTRAHIPNLFRPETARRGKL